MTRYVCKDGTVRNYYYYKKIDPAQKKQPGRKKKDAPIMVKSEEPDRLIEGVPIERVMHTSIRKNLTEKYNQLGETIIKLRELLKKYDGTNLSPTSNTYTIYRKDLEELKKIIDDAPFERINGPEVLIPGGVITSLTDSFGNVNIHDNL